MNASLPKILAVDDDPANLAALAKLLSRIDAELITASSGNEALAATLDHDFALILLDANMPGMDGFEVAEILSGEEKTRNIPIIFLTAAYKEETYRLRGYGAGAVDYIEKPINEMIFLTKVGVFLDIFTKRQRLGRLLDVLEHRVEMQATELEDHREARRTAEDNFGRQKSLFEAIFNCIPDAIVFTGTDSLIVTVNSGFVRLFGYSLQEVIRRATLILLEHPEDYLVDDVRYPGDTGDGDPRPHVVPYRKKGGEVFPGETVGTRVVDAKGRAIGFLHIIRDVSDRQRADSQLRRALETAEIANQAKSVFLANMSHELRTPLNAINGFAEILTLELFGALPEVYRRYAEDIHLSGQHLLRLIADLLDMSLIDVGDMQLSDEVTDLGAIIEESVRLLGDKAQRAGVRVRTRFDGRCELLVDPLRIKQVILNLLANAVKYAPGGEILITLSCNGTWIDMAVTDTGPGMSPEDIRIALLPFGQAERQATVRRFGGTGLGLPLARRLVELHLGRLEISSQPGHGTTVTVRLPMARAVVCRDVNCPHYAHRPASLAARSECA